MAVLHWPKLFEGQVSPDGDISWDGWGTGYGYSFSGGGEGGGNFQGRGSGAGNASMVGNGWGCSHEGDNYGSGESPQSWN
jgi:hypothetical protein